MRSKYISLLIILTPMILFSQSFSGKQYKSIPKRGMNYSSYLFFQDSNTVLYTPANLMDLSSQSQYIGSYHIKSNTIYFDLYKLIDTIVRVSNFNIINKYQAYNRDSIVIFIIVRDAENVQDFCFNSGSTTNFGTITVKGINNEILFKQKINYGVRFKLPKRNEYYLLELDYINLHPKEKYEILGVYDYNLNLFRNHNDFRSYDTEEQIKFSLKYDERKDILKGKYTVYESLYSPEVVE